MNALSSAYDFKATIVRAVNLYIQNYPAEYRALLDVIAMKKTMTKDEYAKIDGSPDMRPLYELSENLQAEITKALVTEHTDGGIEWWKTKEGAHWFVSAFPQFALPKTI